MVGDRFGKLTVIESFKTCKERGRIWLLRCDCGNEAMRSTRELNKIKEPACRECYSKALSLAKTKHGASGKGEVKRDPLYVIWLHMRDRCNNARNIAYKYYGGKGVTVCDEWGEFLAFKQWALVSGYQHVETKNHAERISIDRIDSSKGYSPDNCQWLTVSENTSRAKRA